MKGIKDVFIYKYSGPPIDTNVEHEYYSLLNIKGVEILNPEVERDAEVIRTLDGFASCVSVYKNAFDYRKIQKEFSLSEMPCGMRSTSNGVGFLSCNGNLIATLPYSNMSEFVVREKNIVYAVVKEVVAHWQQNAKIFHAVRAVFKQQNVATLVSGMPYQADVMHISLLASENKPDLWEHYDQNPQSLFIVEK